MLVPANDLDRAKGRLASLLSADERRLLFLATLETVVGACRDAGLRTVVLTRDMRIADALGDATEVLDEDPALSGLNAQLERALAMLESSDVLVLHADLPFASAGSVREMVEAGPAAPSVTLVRSRDGGTNAMRLSPPGRFALAYGRDSFARHRDAAVAAGLAVALCDIPGLALDIDTVDDLHVVMDTPGSERTRVGALLQSFALRERLVVDE